MSGKKILFIFGWPFSPLYALIMRLRAHLYKIGFFKEYKANVPVISVGNLTMGGTGKTPTVCYIADLLQQKGYSPAIISRGYTGKANKTINIVSDKKQIYLDADLAGDEPFMLAKMLPGVPVLTGKKRYQTCGYAINELGCNVLILDDGFQHLKVCRDFNIALFDKSIAFGVDRVFPGGDLREDKNALHRADMFLITGFNDTDHNDENNIETFLQTNFSTIPILRMTKTESSFFQNGTSLIDKSEIPTRVAAFCGIANPNRFKNDLIKNGFDVQFFSTFKDHHIYTDNDVKKLLEQAKDKELEAILTTDKDMVKLNAELFSIPCISVRLNSTIEKGFNKHLFSSLNYSSQKS